MTNEFGVDQAPDRRSLQDRPKYTRHLCHSSAPSSEVFPYQTLMRFGEDVIAGEGNHLAPSVMVQVK